jgi:hypothetical protein
VISPPTNQASKIKLADGRLFAMIPVVRKIPEPRIIPTIIMVESNNPNCRIKPDLLFNFIVFTAFGDQGRFLKKLPLDPAKIFY